MARENSHDVAVKTVGVGQEGEETYVSAKRIVRKQRLLCSGKTFTSGGHEEWPQVKSSGQKETVGWQGLDGSEEGPVTGVKASKQNTHSCTESLGRLLHGAGEMEEQHEDRCAPHSYLLDEPRFERHLL